MQKRIVEVLTRSIAAIILGALFGAAADAEDPKPKEAPTISASELQARRDAGTAPTVIDVRTQQEYLSGHIPGAVNIPFDQVAERISEVDAPNGVVLHCMIGPRARKGESALLAAGYESVFHLEGGLAAWKAAGLPVEGAPSDTRGPTD